MSHVQVVVSQHLGFVLQLSLDMVPGEWAGRTIP